MPKHLHETFPFLLNRIAALVSDAVNREFRPLVLNVFGARVRILLFLDDVRTVGDLAQGAALDQSTLSHILRRLERLGYLSKERQEHDNRLVKVSLTQEGASRRRDLLAGRAEARCAAYQGARRCEEERAEASAQQAVRKRSGIPCGRPPQKRARDQGAPIAGKPKAIQAHRRGGPGPSPGQCASVAAHRKSIRRMSQVGGWKSPNDEVADLT